MNLERLEKLAVFLEGLNPKRFNMSTWCSAYDISLKDSDRLSGEWMRDPPCGTYACISGWACHLSWQDETFKGRLALAEKILSTVRNGVCLQARLWLGLTASQAQALFIEYDRDANANPVLAAKAVRALMAGSVNPWGATILGEEVSDWEMVPS